MSLFDRMVDQALKNQEELAPLRIVVEKELLHHDILREMSRAGLLRDLTFIGGTCLRACYGSRRLSEDLDFTGGTNFQCETLAELGQVLVKRLQIKYDLHVEVSEPKYETGNVATWKLKITTRPGQSSMPLQRIHIDICAIPSYEPRPMMLRNFYNVEMGTSGLIFQAQSREEILADKIVAFALRPNRIKNRDLWDIGWLKQQNITLPLELISRKAADHGWPTDDFQRQLNDRVRLLIDASNARETFVQEMKRFLPPRIVRETVEKKDFWVYLTNLITAEGTRVTDYLERL